MFRPTKAVYSAQYVAQYSDKHLIKAVDVHILWKINTALNIVKIVNPNLRTVSAKYNCRIFKLSWKLEYICLTICSMRDSTMCCNSSTVHVLMVLLNWSTTAVKSFRSTLLWGSFPILRLFKMEAKCSRSVKNSDNQFRGIILYKTYLVCGWHWFV